MQALLRFQGQQLGENGAPLAILLLESSCEFIERILQLDLGGLYFVCKTLAEFIEIKRLQFRPAVIVVTLLQRIITAATEVAPRLCFTRGKIGGAFGLFAAEFA